MALVWQKHRSSQAVSCLVAEIVFNSEFTSLWEELTGLYRDIALINPGQEAFQDAFYTIYTERESSAKHFPRTVREVL